MTHLGAVAPLNSTDSLSAASRRDRAWLIAAFAAAILLQFYLVLFRAANWDEFFHLSEAHAFYDGRLTEVLQVFYARAFFWLPALPLDAVDQIRVARVFMFALQLFTTCAIYQIGRGFAGRVPAALAALAYLTGGYVFQHGFSYRADPMAAAFLMGALWILARGRLGTRDILLGGALVGLAVLTTIKVVFYLPAFAALAWLRWRTSQDRRRTAHRLVAFALAAAVFSALFVGLTILSLPTGSHSAAKTVSTSGSMMFAGGLFPRWPYILGAVTSAPILAALVILTPAALHRAPLTRPEKLALFGLMLPLASLVIYRNSFPYFYAYILPPVMVAAAVAVRDLIRRIPVPVLATALLANAIVLTFATPWEVLPRQKQVLAVAHRVFPQPMPYFDFPGMLVDFPKANFFMTSWGMRKYRAGHEEALVDVLARETVPLLVVNQPLLQRNQTGAALSAELLPADARALREGFVPHWGPLWVAGRRFAPSGSAQPFTIYSPGRYTLEGGDAQIDGLLLRRGETVELGRGQHRLQAIGREPVTLRWGDHLYRPTEPFDGGPLFQGF